MTSATTYYLLRHIPALKKKSHSARSGKVPILSAEKANPLLVTCQASYAQLSHGQELTDHDYCDYDHDHHHDDHDTNTASTSTFHYLCYCHCYSTTKATGTTCLIMSRNISPICHLFATLVPTRSETSLFHSPQLSLMVS